MEDYNVTPYQEADMLANQADGLNFSGDNNFDADTAASFGMIGLGHSGAKNARPLIKLIKAGMPDVKKTFTHRIDVLATIDSSIRLFYPSVAAGVVIGSGYPTRKGLIITAPKVEDIEGNQGAFAVYKSNQQTCVEDLISSVQNSPTVLSHITIDSDTTAIRNCSISYRIHSPYKVSEWKTIDFSNHIDRRVQQDKFVEIDCTRYGIVLGPDTEIIGLFPAGSKNTITYNMGGVLSQGLALGNMLAGSLMAQTKERVQ